MRSPRIALTLILVVIAVALGSGPVSPYPVHASDHRDVPLAIVAPGGDLTDYFALVTYSGPPHSPFLGQITVTTRGIELPGTFNVESVEPLGGGVFVDGDSLYTPLAVAPSRPAASRRSIGTTPRSTSACSSRPPWTASPIPTSRFSSRTGSSRARIPPIPPLAGVGSARRSSSWI